MCTARVSRALTGSGGADDDEIHGSDRQDLICGGAGDDLSYGRGDDDLISGDLCTCEAGGINGCPNCETTDDDSCHGDAGDDEVFCFNLADGGSGTDICDAVSGDDVSCEADSCFSG